MSKQSPADLVEIKELIQRCEKTCAGTPGSDTVDFWKVHLPGRMAAIFGKESQQAARVGEIVWIAGLDPANDMRKWLTLLRSAQEAVEQEIKRDRAAGSDGSAKEGEMAGYYDTQQICLKGHQITTVADAYPDTQKNFCPDCGEATIKKCQSCGAKIKGLQRSSGYLPSPAVEIPACCDQCGTRFPWDVSAIRKPSLHSLPATLPGEEVVRRLFQHFHRIAKQLERRRGSASGSQRPTLAIADEYDVQDLMHALLLLDFDDVRAEEPAPSKGGSWTREDFKLPDCGIVVEAKMTRTGLGNKELKTQLHDDIGSYAKDPDCKHLMVFVYDPDERLKNPRGFEKDFGRTEGKMAVEVFIRP